MGRACTCEAARARMARPALHRPRHPTTPSPTRACWPSSVAMVEQTTSRRPALADLLDEAEPTPRLVVLNSCQSGAGGTTDLFSGTAAALAHSGIRAVAAMQFSISDAAALAFARGFYTALAHNTRNRRGGEERPYRHPGPRARHARVGHAGALPARRCRGIVRPREPPSASSGGRRQHHRSTNALPETGYCTRSPGPNTPQPGSTSARRSPPDRSRWRRWACRRR